MSFFSGLSSSIKGAMNSKNPLEGQPKFLEVVGAGSTEVNGIYELCAEPVNGKPAYIKCEADELSGNRPVIWYFYSKLYAVYGYNGYYLSKHASLLMTAAVDSASDYYTHYTHGPSVPFTGWETQLPSTSVAAGCGANPAPKIRRFNQNDMKSSVQGGLTANQLSARQAPSLEELSLYKKPALKRTASLTGVFQPVYFPQFYSIAGCGDVTCNGVYEYCGFFNERPFFRKRVTMDESKAFEVKHGPRRMQARQTLSKQREKAYQGINKIKPVSKMLKLRQTSDEVQLTSDEVQSTLVDEDDMDDEDIKQKEGLSSASGDNANKVEYRYLYFFFSQMFANPLTQRYNGWYVSQESPSLAFKSSLSAANDFYSVSSDAFLPPTDGWFVREPSMKLDAGCGTKPAPSSLQPNESPLIVGPTPAYNRWFKNMLIPRKAPSQLVKILIEGINVEMCSIIMHNACTIWDLKLELQYKQNTPAFLMRLSTSGSYDTPLDNEMTIQDAGIKNLDTLTLELSSLLQRANYVAPHRTVLICGAGPVGLFIAVQLKLLAPAWDVVIHEQREVYARTHGLRMRDLAFHGMAEYEVLLALKDKWQPRTRTSVIESDLKELAFVLGVRLRYNVKVTSVQMLLDEHEANPNSDYDKAEEEIIVIGCDGARSVLRADMQEGLGYEDEFCAAKHVGDVLQIKFDARGKVETKKGMFAEFLTNLPAKSQFFKVLPSNYDEVKQCTPMTILALTNKTAGLREAMDEKMTELQAVAAEVQVDANQKPTSSFSSMKKTKKQVKTKNKMKSSLSPSFKRSTSERKMRKQKARTKAAGTYYKEDKSISNEKLVELSKDIISVVRSVCPDGIVESSLKIGLIPASYFVSNVVAARYQDGVFTQANESMHVSTVEDGLEAKSDRMTSPAYVFLAGDAAMGLSLEKGVNYGYNIASDLVQRLVYSSSAAQTQTGFEAAFYKQARFAIKSVDEDYDAYMSQIHSASILRSIIMAPVNLVSSTSSMTSSIKQSKKSKLS